MEKSATEFLLAEFNSLQDRANQLEELKSSRINFFLVIVAAALAGLTSFIGVSNFPITVNFIILAVSLILFLIGLTTLTQIVQYSIAIVSFYRKAGRIRRWFVDVNPEILDYVAFKPADDSPNVYVGASTFTFRGGDGIVLLVNSITLSVLVLSGFSLQIPIPNGSASNNVIVLLTAVLTFFICWIGQKRYIYYELKNSDKYLREDTRFPFKEFQSQKASNAKAETISEKEKRQPKSRRT